MCVTDRKTYVHPDGSQSTVESIRRCPNAVGAGVCDAVQLREDRSVHLVERVPRATPRDSSAGVFETEGFNGRKILYRPVTRVTTKPASRRSSLRPTGDASSPSSIGSQYSPGASFVEVRPSPSTPSSAVSSGHKRVSFQNDTKPAASQAGTTIHGSPSPLELPRVYNEGRLPYRSPSVESISSTSATVDESFRPDIDHRSSMQDGYTSSRGSPSGPALSDLPKVGSRKPRPDSGKSFPFKDSRPRAETSDSARRRAQIQADADARDRRQQKEDEEQAEKERGKLAASEQWQAERVARARKASRERHLQEAAAALEGQTKNAQQQQAASEFAQMARERREAEERRRRSQQYSPTTSSPLSTRASLDRQPYNSPLRSPISPRGPMPLPPRSPTKRAMVHNNYSPPIDTTMRPDAYNERRQDVIAGAQARTMGGQQQRQSMDRSGAQRQTQRLEGALRDMSFEDDFVLFDDDDGDYEEYEPRPSGSGWRGDDRARRARHGRGDYYP